MFGSEGNAVALAYLGVGLLVMIFMLVRAARSSRIDLNNREVVIYSLLRTRHIDLADVRRVFVVQGSSASLISWRVPGFELLDGNLVRADEIRSLADSSIVDEVVDDARSRIP